MKALLTYVEKIYVCSIYVILFCYSIIISYVTNSYESRQHIIAFGIASIIIIYAIIKTSFKAENPILKKLPEIYLLILLWIVVWIFIALHQLKYLILLHQRLIGLIHITPFEEHSYRLIKDYYYCLIIAFSIRLLLFIVNRIIGFIQFKKEKKHKWIES